MKKNLALSVEQKRRLIEKDHAEVPVARQCELLGLARSSYYHEPAGESASNLALMRMIDKIYTEHPYFRIRRMVVWLHKLGRNINKKCVSRLMQRMGLQAIYPKPRLSDPNKQHKKYPYLLRGVEIERTDQVWSTDITYIRLEKGFVYLTAVIALRRERLAQPLRALVVGVHQHGGGLLRGGPESRA